LGTHWEHQIPKKSQSPHETKESENEGTRIGKVLRLYVIRVA